MSKKNILLILITILISVSCRSTIYDVAYPALSDGKYDSEFPYKNSSDDLARISSSVMLLNCLAFYQSHFFAKESNVTLKNLTEDVLLNRTVEVGRYNQTASGTATLIYNENGKVAFLTCAHILDFQDTVYTFYADENGKKTEFLQSVSFKLKQYNFIPELPDQGRVNILVKSRKNDIAIVGAEFPPSLVSKLVPFNYPFGSAKELEWGTFVYAFGFPMNYKMISKAIVSNPDKDDDGNFVIDAVFNKGFSGGIVLAIKDGVPNFELVGMVTSLAAESEYILTPDFNYLKENGFNPLIPYKGNFFVKNKLDIKYGITKVISVENIIEVIEGNESVFAREGFDIIKKLKAVN